MTITALIFLALAMSTDAFAAALGKGAAMQQPRFVQALRIGLLFGCIEAITPLIGWLLGSFASKWIAEWDHWVAFFLLLGLGGHMVWVGLHGDADGADEAGAPSGQGIVALALTAVATSIDAMAVGVGLAFINVNILHAALAIGLATTVMVTVGVLLGRLLGAAIGRKAEIVGGVVLILVGATILYEHLSEEAAARQALVVHAAPATHQPFSGK